MGLSSTQSRATISNRMTPKEISYLLDQYYLCEAKRVRCVGTVFLYISKDVDISGFRLQMESLFVTPNSDGPS